MTVFSDQQRAHLDVLTKMEGFPLLQTIFKDELEKFTTRLLNIDITATDQEVVALQRLAKAAAQYYQGVVNRLNEELEFYRKTNAPIEPTDETNLDLDVITEHLPNFFDGGE